jgi:hypothetical protein
MKSKGWILVSKVFSLTRSRVWRTRTAAALAMAGALTMSTGLVLLSPQTANADKPGAPGNNGTVKVGDTGDLSEQRPENDPHLPCTFNVQWFNFDSGWGTLNASVAFALWPPTSGAGYSMTVTGNTAPSFVGNGGQPGAGDGMDHLEWYTLGFTGSPHPQQGFHVKVTVTTPHSQGNDTKSKVYWVGPCQPTTPSSPSTPTTPAKPSTPSTPTTPATPTTPSTPTTAAAPSAAVSSPTPEVLGSESSRPKPTKTKPPVKATPQPTVLGTQAVAPTAVAAGLPDNSGPSSTGGPLGQLLVGSGVVLLLAGGWLGFGRREHGAHQA